uniref:Uncharacterized protein n=1 Tax=Megaselia scalaris TaxID=36166 RepID=T1GZE1_MEGSC
MVASEISKPHGHHFIVKITKKDLEKMNAMKMEVIVVSSHIKDHKEGSREDEGHENGDYKQLKILRTDIGFEDRTSEDRILYAAKNGKLKGSIAI